MTRAIDWVALASMVIAAPSLAQTRAVQFNVPAVTLREAVTAVSVQGGASIGFRDPALAHLRIRALHGRMTVDQALERMLEGTPLRARRVAPNTYLIERRPPAPRLPLAPAPILPPPTVASTSDIIVTASKRDIPLGAYPGGVEIIAGDELGPADAIRGTGAIEARLASVGSTHLGPGRNKLFIRGIAESSFVGPTQATVGQYWGNSRVSYSAPDPNLRLYDVEHVEVLEGPQGTLYGAGSLGGIIRVVPNAPDDSAAFGATWLGAQAVQHGRPGFDGGAMLNLPLVEDRLALRALAFGGYEGGYINDTARRRNDINKVRTYGGRAALRYHPDDEWVIDANIVGQHTHGEDSQYAERGGDGLTRQSAISQPYSNDFLLGEMALRRHWGDVEFTGSLGMARQEVTENFEGPALSTPTDPGQAPVIGALPANFAQATHIRMLMGEARLSRQHDNGQGWLFGASFLRNSARVNRVMSGLVSDTALTGVLNRNTEFTLFGETGIALDAQVTVTLGGRMIHSQLSGHSEDVIESVAYSRDPSVRSGRSETRFLPSAALTFRPDSHLTLYARYQQGFRPGGIAIRREYVEFF